MAAATEAATNVSLLRIQPGSNSRSSWIQRKAEPFEHRSRASCASTRRKVPSSSVFCCRSRDPLRISGGDWHPHEDRRVAAQWPRAAGRRPEHSTPPRASGPSRLSNPPWRTAPAFALANAALCKFVYNTGAASLYYSVGGRDASGRYDHPLYTLACVVSFSAVPSFVLTPHCFAAHRFRP